MNSFAEKYRSMKITSKSPDQSATVVSSRSGFTVSLEPSRLAEHTERSLSTQISLAASGAVRAHHNAMRKVGNEVRDNLGLDARRHAQDRQNVDGVLADIDVVAVSDSGHVETNWRAADDVEVRVNPGTLRELDGDRLAAEVQSSIHNAMYQYMKAAKANLSHHMPDIPQLFESTLRAMAKPGGISA